MALSETLIQNTCRVCIVPGKNMTNMFLEKSNDILDKLLFCSGVAFRDIPGYPSHICNKCIFYLSIASKFKTICLHSEQNLTKLLKCTEGEDVPADSLSDVLDFGDNDTNIQNSENQNNHKGEAACSEIKSKKCILKKNTTKMLVKNSEDTRVGIRKETQKKHICVNKNVVPVWQCRPCDKSFKTKYECNKHKRKFHDEGRVCEVCGKYYSNGTSLYRHLSVHSSLRLQCNYCSYETPNKQDLDKHIRIHMGLKAYQCDQCPSAFYTSSNLSIHIQRHHSQLKLKRFACTICEKKFYDRSKLTIHLDGHNAIKRFECDVCHMRFIRRCQWKRHLLKRHSIELPPLKPGPKPHDEGLQKLFSDNRDG